MDQNMETIQNKILEIAIFFDEFCKKNQIKYYMMGGSALGAIRHKGFIPWDDDYDVFMTFDEYQKFLKACEINLDNERFYLQKENTEEWPLLFSKLRMNGTTFIEEDSIGRDMHKGFYIDIMCLNNTSNYKSMRFIQYLAARMISTKALAQRGYTTDKKYKKILLKVVNVLVNTRFKNRLLKYVQAYNTKECEYVGHFFGRAKFSNTSFPKEWLGVPKYVVFENALLPVPAKVECYLELRYGENYMAMPNEETKALYPSHALFVDVDNDYKLYSDTY